MSSIPGIFGPIVTDTRVEAAIMEALRGWLPSYLDDVARQDDVGWTPARPMSWETIRDRTTKWNEQALPAIVVSIGGTIAVTRRGSLYRAVYGCTIGAVVAGQTRENTRQLAGIYSAAIAAALTQHGDLDGFADGIEWVDTDYDTIDQGRSRTLMAAVVTLDVAVNNVLDVFAGPAGDPPDPDDPAIPGLPPYGNVDDVETTLDEIVPITEPLP